MEILWETSSFLALMKIGSNFIHPNHFMKTTDTLMKFKYYVNIKTTNSVFKLATNKLVGLTNHVEYWVLFDKLGVKNFTNLLHNIGGDISIP